MEKTFNQKTKDSWISTMIEHREADRLIRGAWIEDTGDKTELLSGCFFGCAMQTNDRPLEKAAQKMNLPLWLVYLAERIYEGLPKNEYVDWPVKLLEAIPVNKDISLVEHEIAIWRLKGLAENNESVAEAISKVIQCHSEKLAFNDDIDWSAAESAAWSAAESAARSAARSAESAAWSVESKKLLDLLKAV